MNGWQRKQALSRLTQLGKKPRPPKPIPPAPSVPPYSLPPSSWLAGGMGESCQAKCDRCAFNWTVVGGTRYRGMSGIPCPHGCGGFLVFDDPERWETAIRRALNDAWLEATRFNAETYLMRYAMMAAKRSSHVGIVNITSAP